MDDDSSTTASARPAPDPAIQAAVLSALSGAVRAGSGRRPFLTGLWLAAMSVLLEAGDPADVMALVFDRLRTIRGHGRNADAPAIVEDDEARSRRSAEAGIAARSIVQSLGRLPETQEPDFPERFLDVALSLLVEAWGPTHVRRALWDQHASIEAGGDAVILPAEPAVSNGAARTPRPAPPPERVEVRAIPVPSPLPEASGPPRRIEVHADASLLDDGRVVYALAVRIDRRDVREMREITGVRMRRTLAATVVEGVVSFLEGLGPSVGDTVRIGSAVEGVLRLVSDEGTDEEALASALSIASEGRQVGWSHRGHGVGTELGRRCDRALRDRIDDEVRSGVNAA